MSQSDENGVVVLHHGTIMQAASSIIREGWKPMDEMDAVAEVATAHDLSPAGVTQHLQKKSESGFHVGRARTVSFAPSRADAEHGWAQRAPEVEFEALWAVYQMKHPTLDDPLCLVSDIAGQAWVWDQMRTDQPAVVSYKTCYTEMIDLGARVPGFRAKPLPPMELLDLAPEIVYDLPFKLDRNRLTVTPIARHLPWDVFAHKLGLGQEEFERCAANGDFGVPASEGVSCLGIWITVRPWWTAEHPALAGR